MLIKLSVFLDPFVGDKQEIYINPETVANVIDSTCLGAPRKSEIHLIKLYDGREYLHSDLSAKEVAGLVNGDTRKDTIAAL